MLKNKLNNREFESKDSQYQSYKEKEQQNPRETKKEQLPELVVVRG